MKEYSSKQKAILNLNFVSSFLLKWSKSDLTLKGGTVELSMGKQIGAAILSIYQNT